MWRLLRFTADWAGTRGSVFHQQCPLKKIVLVNSHNVHGYSDKCCLLLYRICFLLLLGLNSRIPQKIWNGVLIVMMMTMTVIPFFLLQTECVSSIHVSSSWRSTRWSSWGRRGARCGRGCTPPPKDLQCLSSLTYRISRGCELSWYSGGKNKMQTKYDTKVPFIHLFTETLTTSCWVNDSIHSY